MAALVQIMAWRQTGHKPLSELMLIRCPDTYMRHLALSSAVIIAVLYMLYYNGTQLYILRVLHIAFIKQRSAD